MGNRFMIRWKISILYYWIAYFITLGVGVGHTFITAFFLKMKSVMPIEKLYITAYNKTMPFHPLYTIVIWTLAAFFYFHIAKPSVNNKWKTALFLGIGWTVITIIFDMFAWVIIRHPWSMSWKDFYIDYQPWITLEYIAILVSPYIGSIMYKNNKVKDKMS